MVWCNFLHIYQPANQIKEIFDKVVSECYRPLFKSLIDNPEAKVTININAALTERLIEYPEVLNDLIKAANNRQIEFTDSAKYHTLLPFLPEDEIERQINLNRETNKRIIGEAYNPIGFFPPEMAYSNKLSRILERMGYKWVIIDEIALNGKLNQLNKSVSYKIKGTNLNVFFRERGPSNLIMSAMVRHKEDLKYDETKGYMVTGMDGETFGHHRPGLQTLLTELLTSTEFEHAFFSELPKLFPATETVTPVVSTWASSQKDIEDGIQFISWNDPNNAIHKLQWELQNLVLKSPNANREKLDMGLASDQFFWASAKPWWSLEQIELGAWTLLDAARSEKAYDLYLRIIATAFEWQRSGKVRELSHEMKETARIPFKDKTEKEPWIYNAFIDMMKGEMKKAAEKENYEEALLWRDAIWKLETKNDIFDAVHAIDLLRRQIPDTTIREILDKYTADYKNLVSGQPEQRAI
ncbi:MAG: UvrB/UvrC motif-containing protein [bacterium]|nr:UvrB/UvrC motif-containing protein [bacterium]